MLEPINPDQTLAEARKGFEAAKKRVDEYNALVDIGNALIEKQKEATDVATSHPDIVEELHHRFLAQRAKDHKQHNFPNFVGPD